MPVCVSIKGRDVKEKKYRYRYRYRNQTRLHRWLDYYVCTCVCMYVLYIRTVYMSILLYAMYCMYCI